MERKIRLLENFDREIGTLEGACLDINVRPGSELHDEIMSMDRERKMLKGSLFL